MKILVQKVVGEGLGPECPSREGPGQADSGEEGPDKDGAACMDSFPRPTVDVDWLIFNSLGEMDNVDVDFQVKKNSHL